MIEVEKLKNIINNWANSRKGINDDIWDEATTELANEIKTYTDKESVGLY